MTTIESQLIKAVYQKDYLIASSCLEQIILIVNKKYTDINYLKNYFIMLIGIFYWNQIKDSKDEVFLDQKLKKRNELILMITRARSKQELEKVFYHILAHYTHIDDELIEKCNNPYIRHIIQYIYLNSHKNITLSSLSQQFHISKSYLSQLLTVETRHSLPQLIRKFRMEKAIKLLDNKNLSILEISQAIGFHSLSYFCDQFKKWTSYTPKEYQRQKLM